MCYSCECCCHCVNISGLILIPVTCVAHGEVMFYVHVPTYYWSLHCMVNNNMISRSFDCEVQWQGTMLYGIHQNCHTDVWCWSAVEQLLCVSTTTNGCDVHSRLMSAWTNNCCMYMAVHCCCSDCWIISSIYWAKDDLHVSNLNPLTEDGQHCRGRECCEMHSQLLVVQGLVVESLSYMLRCRVLIIYLYLHLHILSLLSALSCTRWESPCLQDADQPVVNLSIASHASQSSLIPH